MQMRTAIALGALLTLAACGDDQTAKAPDKSNNSTAQTTGSDSAGTAAAPPSATTAPAAPSTSTATAPTGSAAPSSSAGSTATSSGSALNSGAAETATNSAGTSGATQTSMPPGATPIDSADDLKGRNFSAGQMALQFSDSQRFVMTDAQTNDRIEGNYKVENGSLVLSDPTGNAANASFPMRCGLQSSAADSFQLSDSDGSCAKLKDQSFKTAGG